MHCSCSDSCDMVITVLSYCSFAVLLPNPDCDVHICSLCACCYGSTLPSLFTTSSLPSPLPGAFSSPPGASLPTVWCIPPRCLVHPSPPSGPPPGASLPTTCVPQERHDAKTVSQLKQFVQKLPHMQQAKLALSKRRLSCGGGGGGGGGEGEVGRGRGRGRGGDGERGVIFGISI